MFKCGAGFRACPAAWKGCSTCALGLRWLAMPTVFVLLFAFAAQTTRADDPPGAKLYATYCAACHGAGGKGGFAPALGSEKYLNEKDDAAITQATREGIVAKGMPAWGQSKGGALTDDQIGDIVAYLRSLYPTLALASGTTTAAPAPTAVAQPGTTGVVVQTKLAVTQSIGAEGETVVNATLKTYDGTPVGGAAIAFSRATTFGVVDLGTAKTNANGIAALTLAQVPAEAREVTAAFKGDKNLDASAARIALQPRRVASASGDFNVDNVRLSLDEPLLAPEGSLITPNPPLVPTTIFALVVGCVWAMYGYVISQVVGIWKSGRNAPRENTLRMSSR